MPRPYFVAVYPGKCGKLAMCRVMLLLKDDGTADYTKKRFCGAECKRLDLRDKMRAMRAKLQKASLGHVVSRNKPECGTQQAG